jgi:hypothetical protein
MIDPSTAQDRLVAYGAVRRSESDERNEADDLFQQPIRDHRLRSLHPAPNGSRLPTLKAANSPARKQRRLDLR